MKNRGEACYCAACNQRAFFRQTWVGSVSQASPCSVCERPGVCPACEGEGPCILCGGTGVCPQCKGEGLEYK